MIFKRQKKYAINEFSIDNEIVRAKELILEPWGESIAIKNYRILKIFVFGPVGSSAVESERDGEAITLSFGRSVTVEIEADGRKLRTASGEIPTL